MSLSSLGFFFNVCPCWYCLFLVDESTKISFDTNLDDEEIQNGGGGGDDDDDDGDDDDDVLITKEENIYSPETLKRWISLLIQPYNHYCSNRVIDDH